LGPRGDPEQPGRFASGPIRIPGPGPLQQVSRRPSRRSRRIDLVIGIVLGIVLGIAVIAALVFLGSEDTIDAPRLSTPERQDAGGAVRLPAGGKRGSPSP
jgi:hypothetical protein